MDYRTEHGYEIDSTGVSSSVLETAEGQEMSRRIDALEWAVKMLTDRLEALTSPRADVPAAEPLATLPQHPPHPTYPFKSPPSAPKLPAVTTGITVKSPPMTQEYRRKKEDEIQEKGQEK